MNITACQLKNKSREIKLIEIIVYMKLYFQDQIEISIGKK